MVHARNIQILLPQEESIKGIDIGENYLSGIVDKKFLSDENWSVETAGFNLEYDSDPDLINKWIKKIGLLDSDSVDEVFNQVSHVDLDTGYEQLWLFIASAMKERCES